MIRNCDGTDSNLVDREGNPCACGLIFDDVELEVVYPHTRILTRAEKDALMEDLWDKVHVDPGVPYVWGSGSPTERIEREP